MNTKRLSLISISAVIIFITGLIQIPGPAGVSFQLSSSASVILCLMLGPLDYFISGIIASLISLMMGASMINIFVSFAFRMGVILFLLIVKNKKIYLIFSGFVGSYLARIILSKLLETPLSVLMISAMPGIIISSILSYFLYFKLEKVIKVNYV